MKWLLFDKFLHQLTTTTGMSIGTTLWAPIANNCSDFWILAIGTFIAHKLIWLVCNLPYILIEKYSLFQDRKIQPVNFSSIFQLKKT